MGQVRIGTSGWNYKHWRILFYPKGLPQGRWLDFYAERFDTVEINFTFYRLPTASVFKSWHDRSPEGFHFAVKGSRYLTHTRRLLDPKPHVNLFFDRARPLSDHTGPILWQLPPDFSRDDDRLGEFLAAIPGAYKHAIEFRHETWFVDEIFAELERFGVALCVADSPRRPPHCHLTAGWSYVRLHEGTDEGKYTRKQLSDWAAQIDSWRCLGIHSWVYFNNDGHGYALENAHDLMQLLGVKAYETAAKTRQMISGDGSTS
jgi:uncharacterized protein YecE (DUF72 family)